MQKQEKSTLMQTFLYSIKSEETQKLYQILIGYFEEWHQKKIEDLLQLQPIQKQSMTYLFNTSFI